MKAKPILFNGEMVRAILGGRKSQTRRVIKPQPPDEYSELYPCDTDWLYSPSTSGQGAEQADVWEIPRCPYGQPGGLLWVRETWCVIGQSAGEWCKVGYRADDSCSGLIPVENPVTRPLGRSTGAWRASIHMPRWASRITLRVNRVWVERVQDISLYDAIQEGYPDYSFPIPEKRKRCALISKEFNALLPQVRKWFVSLWDSINAKRGFGWDVNPWCWCVEFEVTG